MPTPRRRPRARGQSLTELALILPFMALLLLGIVDLSGAFITKMDLDTALAQGARIGTMEGQGANCSSDSVDVDVLNAILGSKGVQQNNIQQIQVYRVLPDGSPDTTAINTFTTPFTQVVSGVTTPYSTTGNYTWPACSRKVNEPSDSLGISMRYNYRPAVPLPGVSMFTIQDATDQHINPPAGSQPCPIPGIPNNVVAAVASPQPPPSSADRITWNVVPGADSYNLYANVNNTAYSPAPVATVISATTGTTQTTVYTGNVTYAPAAYEVTGVNYCGEGQRSLPAANGQCMLPVTPTLIGATQLITMSPLSDIITYTAPWPGTPPISSTYLLTQTSGTGGSTTILTQTIPISPLAPLTQTTVMTSTGPDPVNYQMASVNACGVLSGGSNIVSRADSAATATAIASSTAAAQATQTAYARATQTAAVQATQTAVAQATQTANAQATQTANAQATQTANAQATQTANAQATQTAYAQATQTAVAQATQTAYAQASQTAAAQATQTAAAQATQTAYAQATQTAVAQATQTAYAQATQTASANATATATALNSGLVAYWKFDEDSGSTTADSTGNGQTGTLHSGVSWLTSALLPAGFGSQVGFNGSSGYISGNATSLPSFTGSQSISWWQYVSSNPTTTENVIALANSASPATNLNVGFRGGTVSVWMSKGSTITPLVSATTAPSAGAWHHFVYTYDSSTGKEQLYVDAGTPINATGTPRSGTPTTFSFGRLPSGSQYFSGYLDDVRIYNRVLSASDVQALQTQP